MFTAFIFDNMTTRQEPEQCMVEEDSQWTLASSMTISRIGSQSTSTATSTGIWPKNVGRKKRKRQKYISNVTKKGTLPRIAKESNQ